MAEDKEQNRLICLSPSQRHWLEAACYEVRQGKQPDSRTLKVKLLNVVPVNFDPAEIDVRRLRNEQPTILCLALFAADLAAVQKADQVWKIIHSLLSTQPTYKVVDIDTILQSTSLSKIDVAETLLKLSEVGLSGSGTTYGENGRFGLGTMNVTEKAFDSFIRYKSLIKYMGSIVETSIPTGKAATKAQSAFGTAPFNKELQRLRKDFEEQASRYSDTTLSICISDAGNQPRPKTRKKPNHAIMLWQYMGNTGDKDREKLFGRIALRKFGLTQAVTTASAVIEGPETELFRRMAHRAASLLPTSVGTTVTSLVMDNFVDPKWPGKQVFSNNSNLLAIWLNLVLVSISTYQPGRFQRETLAVDPFAASLTAFDYILDEGNNLFMGNASTASSLSQRKFKIALTFPGEKRDFVFQVASILEEQIGDVFYDNFYEAELAQPNLDVLLQRIYHDNSELIVVFLCKDYERKEWCGLEWRAVRDLIKKRRDENIMFMRFDDAEISGVFGIDGCIDLQRRSPEQAAELILRRFRVNADAQPQDDTQHQQDKKSQNGPSFVPKASSEQAALELTRSVTSLHEDLYTYYANHYDMAGNTDWRKLRAGLNDFSNAISNYGFLFSEETIQTAREIHDLYAETLSDIDLGNATCDAYSDKPNAKGCEIRNDGWKKLSFQQSELRTRLERAFRKS